MKFKLSHDWLTSLWISTMAQVKVLVVYIAVFNGSTAFGLMK